MMKALLKFAGIGGGELAEVNRQLREL